jgi:hypothetical protein
MPNLENLVKLTVNVKCTLCDYFATYAIGENGLAARDAARHISEAHPGIVQSLLVGGGGQGGAPRV